MVKALREQGGLVWYMNALNEGHGYRKKENRDVYQQATVLFLREHLLQEGSVGGPLGPTPARSRLKPLLRGRSYEAAPTRPDRKRSDRNEARPNTAQPQREQ